MPAKTAQKSRPAFPDGLGCTLGRLLGGGRAGALFLLGGTSQNPVHGILGILQVGAVGKDQLFALSQRGVERDGALIDSAVCQIGVQQGFCAVSLAKYLNFSLNFQQFCILCTPAFSDTIGSWKRMGAQRQGPPRCLCFRSKRPWAVV